MTALVFEDVLAVVNRARVYEAVIAKAGLGITAQQLDALHFLAKQYDLGAISTLGDLGRERHVSPAVVTELAKKLEDAGFIQRVPWNKTDIGDRRAVKIEITKAGRDKHRECRARIQEIRV